MPSSYSKKRSCNSDENDHEGGPLKRTGDAASEADRALGPSILSLPAGQLPLVRNVIQRYRAMRIDDPTSAQSILAKTISKEVQQIWIKARLPILSDRACDRKVLQAIEMWTSCHRKGGRLSQDFQQRLDSLLNVAVRKTNSSDEAFLENYKQLLKKACNPNWEEDFNFFCDQFQVSALCKLSVI